MVRKYSFKLWDNSNDPTGCWHCGEDTLYFLTNLKTREEIFCCPVCAVKIYKLRKIVSRLRNYSQKPKSLKKTQKTRIKIPENTIPQPTSTPQDLSPVVQTHLPEKNSGSFQASLLEVEK